MKRWTIYCHTHVESGRHYVGLTAQTMERRWASHCSKAKSSKGGRWHFPNAIKKYGPDAFSHVALMQLDSVELANAWEEFWIDFLDTRNPERGFNLAKGGEHVPHPIRRNPWDDPEYRAKQLPRVQALLRDPAVRANSVAALNTPEGKRKRSEASRMVRTRPEVMARMAMVWTGRTHTDEARAKVSKANAGKVIPVEVRAKISASNRSGDPEVRAKLRASNRSHEPSVRAKISASLVGLPAGPDRVRKLKEYYQNRRSFMLLNPPTGKQCKHHGWVDFQDCFFFTEKSGKVRLVCKKCSRDHGMARRARLLVP